MNTKKKNYRETLDFLYTQLPMFQRIGAAAFKKDLSNTLALCEALGNPQKQFLSIHIAGTNGKGTTSHLLSAVFQAHGRKTGLYTSPHYRDFRERIKVDGKLMSRAKVVQFVEQQQHLFTDIQPSFFEITVAMAFQHFAQSKVDIGVIETGLGGRLDSTNVILPQLSIITNISYDHQQFLGDTLPLIAGEKAGIIKKRVPIIIGEKQAETTKVFLEKAAKAQAPITFASDNYRVELLEEIAPAHSVYRVWRQEKMILDRLVVNLRGPFQARNLVTLFQALEVLKEQDFFHWQEDRLRYALENLRELSYYIGRWQVLNDKPLTITDSAHNEGGLTLVLKALQELPHQKMHIVLGAVNDKDLGKVLALFPPQAHYYFARPNIPRGLDAAELKRQAAPLGLKGRSYVSVRQAWQAARRKAGTEDLIFIGGSTFVVAEIVGV